MSEETRASIRLGRVPIRPAIMLTKLSDRGVPCGGSNNSYHPTLAIRPGRAYNSGMTRLSLLALCLLPNARAQTPDAPEKLQPHYPRLAEFKELVNRFDPQGKFRNDFVQTNLYA